MKCILTAVLVLSLTGCGTLIGGGPLTVYSDPFPAVITVDGDTVGRTPIKFQPPSGSVLRISAPQHFDRDLRVRRTFNFMTLGNGLIAMGGIAAVTDSLQQDVGLGVGMIATGLAGFAWDYYSGGMWRYRRSTERIALVLDREAAYADKPWPERFRNAVIEQEVMIGMTRDMVREAWGRPVTINRTVTERGETQQWVYGRGHYVYFDESGVVTTVQARGRE